MTPREMATFGGSGVDGTRTRGLREDDACAFRAALGDELDAGKCADVAEGSAYRAPRGRFFAAELEAPDDARLGAVADDRTSASASPPVTPI